ncbi:hypothetical protein ScPMuIL_008526 [Solemya velum]
MIAGNNKYHGGNIIRNKSFWMLSISVVALCWTIVVGKHVNETVIDMTHNLSVTSPLWGGLPEFKFNIIVRGRMPGGFWLEGNTFETPDHAGTHLDAPSHYVEGAWRTQEIPVEKLVGPGVIINVTDKVLSDPDYRVVTSDIHEWEKKYGRIPENAIVIMNSGWQYKFPDRNAVFNTEDPDNRSSYHFPGWHEDAVAWLIENRDINILGVDTPSIDYGQSFKHLVHIILGQNEIPAAENVANLDNVPESGCTVYVGVIKLYDGSAGPARIFAINSGAEYGARAFLFTTLAFVFFLLLMICVG